MELRQACAQQLLPHIDALNDNDVIWQKWYDSLLRLEKRYARKQGVATFESDATFGVIAVALRP